MSGYVKNILIQSGQYVETGQALATVAHNRRLVLRADVSQRYLPVIKNVQTATFTTPYDGAVYDLADLNGKLLSFGKSSDGNSFYTPVSFGFDNKGDIIEGSFVEVYLKSQPVAGALVVPVSALIEEQGKFFVFVQQDGDNDEYLKTEVAAGDSDGRSRQILNGLKSGQKVVSKGVYALKLAALSGLAPEHSHQH
jgi:multidrug efflux pump subunit AcrA (membrane-fusion protein)